MEDRLSHVEDSVNALQHVLTAIDSYDYVTSIDPIVEGDHVAGYIFSFAHSIPIPVGIYPYDKNSSIKSVDYQANIDYALIHLTNGKSIKLPKFNNTVLPASIVILNNDVKFNSIGDTVRVLFYVNPSNASVNFNVSSVACQLKLGKVSANGFYQDSNYCHLERVEREFDEEGHYVEGKYIAFIVDDSECYEYTEDISLAVDIGNNSFVSSSTFSLSMDTRNFDSLRSKQELWLKTLCSREFAGRKTASPGDCLAFEFIKSECRKMGYSPIESIFYSKNGHILRNIQINISGEVDSTIVIGSHYDGAMQSSSSVHYPAANDNASGVVVNLSVLDALTRTKISNKATIECCFWDGEEFFDGNCFWGSRYYVNSLIDKNLVEYYINIDSVGHCHSHSLFVKHKGYRYVPDLLRKLYSNTRFTYVDIDMNEIGGGSTDYVPFGDAGIPYIGFGDHNGDMCSNNSHSINDSMDVISLERISKHMENILDIINQ